MEWNGVEGSGGGGVGHGWRAVWLGGLIEVSDGFEDGDAIGFSDAAIEEHFVDDVVCLLKVEHDLV